MGLHHLVHTDQLHEPDQIQPRGRRVCYKSCRMGFMRNSLSARLCNMLCNSAEAHVLSLCQCEAEETGNCLWVVMQYRYVYDRQSAVLQVVPDLLRLSGYSFQPLCQQTAVDAGAPTAALCHTSGLYCILQPGHGFATALLQSKAEVRGGLHFSAYTQLWDT